MCMRRWVFARGRSLFDCLLRSATAGCWLHVSIIAHVVAGVLVRRCLSGLWFAMRARVRNPYVIGELDDEGIVF